MNDYKAKIEAILTSLENAVSHDILLRQTGAKGGRNPKSIHHEATASLLQLLTKARIEELEELLKLAEEVHTLKRSDESRSLIIYLKSRIAELKKGIGQNE